MKKRVLLVALVIMLLLIPFNIVLAGDYYFTPPSVPSSPGEFMQVVAEFMPPSLKFYEGPFLKATGKHVDGEDSTEVIVGLCEDLVEAGRQVIVDILDVNKDGTILGIIGYDGRGQQVVTRFASRATYQSIRETATVSFTPEEINSISKLQIVGYRPRADIYLLSANSFKDGDKYYVTGNVFNGLESQVIGMVVTAYDAQGKAIESKSDYDFKQKGYTGNFKVELASGTLVDHVDVKVCGKAQDIELLSSGWRNEGDKVIVTGVVENGTAISQVIGMVVTAYDAQGKAIESKSDYDLKQKDYTGNFKVELASGTLVDHVDVKVCGKAQDIELLSSGWRNEGDKVIVTGVVENGTPISQVIGIVVTAYDAQGKAIESKSDYGLKQKRYTGNFKVELASGTLVNYVDVEVYNNTESELDPENIPQIWPEKLNQSECKTWKIEFSMVLEISSINGESVYVSTDVDGQNKVLGIMVEPEGPNLAIVKPPIGGWKTGEYYLHITPQVKSSVATGSKSLSCKTRMKFTIN